MRLKITIEYTGTRYSGWQIQTNARTIQGEIERAIADATDIRDFELYGSGRTDAGVHALAQVAHLEIASTMPPDTLRRRVNEALPSDIVILAAEKVRHRFHARHDAVARSYLYHVARRRTAFAKPYVWWVKDDLNVADMRAAAARLVGFRDFQAFAHDDPKDKSTEVLLDRLDILEMEDLILVHAAGSHFLWRMVRRLVGVLVEVGRGGLSVAGAAEMIGAEAGTAARLTAPASGLFLARVYYPGDPQEAPIRPAVTIRRW